MAKARRNRRHPGRARRVADPEAPRREHWKADGTPKVRFPSSDDANRASLRARLEAGADLLPSPCHFCGGWHLGNQRR